MSVGREFRDFYGHGPLGPDRLPTSEEIAALEAEQAGARTAQERLKLLTDEELSDLALAITWESVSRQADKMRRNRAAN